MIMSLLDYLVFNTSAAYLSDLRFRLGECAHALRELDNPEAFALDEWNRAGVYLVSAYKPQSSCRAAQDAIVRSLDAVSS